MDRIQSVASIARQTEESLPNEHPNIANLIVLFTATLNLFFFFPSWIPIKYNFYSLLSLILNNFSLLFCAFEIFHTVSDPPPLTAPTKRKPNSPARWSTRNLADKADRNKWKVMKLISYERFRVLCNERNQKWITRNASSCVQIVGSHQEDQVPLIKLPRKESRRS